MSAEPPPYAVTAKDVAPPPSYESLFGKIKKAKDESDGNVQFVSTCCGIICGSFACIICLGVFLAIPITMIVIGSVHLDDCPVQRMIPIYLIVGGCFGLLSNLITMGRSVKKNKEDGEEEKKSMPGFEQIINTFLFAWFIAGNVWVYGLEDSEWQGSNSSLTDTYCHRRVYYFAFWLITSSYIILGLVCLIGIITCFVMFCCCKKE